MPYLALILFILIVLAIKFYVVWGWGHVFPNQSKRARLVYGILSVATFALGVGTIIGLIRTNNTDMGLAANLAVAVMISFLICELLLCILFLFSDLSTKGVGAFGYGKNQVKSRRKFLKTGAALLTGIPFLGFMRGITFGKYDFTIRRVEVSFSDLPSSFDGFKLVQFSDFHSGSFDNISQVEKGIKKMQDEQADIILFTGDLVNEFEDEILPYKKMLTDLNGSGGKYAVLGNHDYPFHGERFRDDEHGRSNLEAIKQHHSDMGFNLLLNSHEIIERSGERIIIGGCENWGTRFGKIGDVEKTIEGIDESDFVLLMSHDPTHWDERIKGYSKKIHLTLSGHTHGFQMGIEIPWLKWSPSQYIYSKWAGLYEEDNQYLYVNRGFGWLGFAGRVGIPPEITVITLRRA